MDSHTSPQPGDFPSLFVSHGSPMTALQGGPAPSAWRRLGERLIARHGRPRSVLAVSAHSLARAPALLAAPRQHAVHDFSGFDPALYQLRYAPDGAPALAAEVRALLQAGGVTSHLLGQGGLDHGIWVPLRELLPAADVPVLPLALVPDASPAQQFALGELLAPLRRQGVLILASGSLTHNLGQVFGPGGMRALDAPEAPDVAAFRAWMLARSQALDWTALLDYRRQAPHAAAMHPSDEHLLPWYVAAGAGGRATLPQRLHASVTHGVLGMDVYAFGEGAADLDLA